MRDFRWMSKAACKGMTTTFFPALVNDNHMSARKICAECPVQFDCEDYARGLLDVETPIYKGLWAGKTISELRGIERKPSTRVLPVCANVRCEITVPPNRNGRGKPRKFCSDKCKKNDEYTRYRNG